MSLVPTSVFAGNVLPFVTATPQRASEIARAGNLGILKASMGLKRLVTRGQVKSVMKCETTKSGKRIIERYSLIR